MSRNVVIVNATQVVTSESNPNGIFSTISEFPKTFDSINYNDDIGLTMRMAKSAYYDQLSKNYANVNPARVMTTVTLEMASGEQILRESIGSFPVMESESEVIEE